MWKPVLFQLLHSLSGHIPLSRLIRWTGQSLFLPFYHSIGPASALPHIRHLYPPRSEKLFRQDLDYLLSYFEPLTLRQLYTAIIEKQSFQRPVCFLSFDDGLREVYDIARPILLEKGIPASFFLNPNFIDNRDLMFRYKASLLIETFHAGMLDESMKRQARDLLMTAHCFHQTIPASLLSIRFGRQDLLDQIASLWKLDWQAFLLRRQPYLSTEQIRQMQKEGFTFGAHSLDHRRYYDWPLEEQLHQTKESMRWVNQQFAPEIPAFAFPFTDHLVSKAFFEEILGETGGIALTFGGAGLKRDISSRQLQRFPMEKTRLSASKLIPAEYVYYLLKAPFGKNCITR